MAKKAIEITKHILVPKHTKVSEKEKKELIEKYHLSFNQLPKIKSTDPAIANLNLSEGDIVKILRQSPTSGKITFYRGVING